MNKSSHIPAQFEALNLKGHILTAHEKLKLFQCSICDYKCGLKVNTKSQADRMHEDIDVEIFYLGDKNHKSNNCDFKTGLKDDRELSQRMVVAKRKRTDKYSRIFALIPNIFCI